ncbi:hypothetical protein EJF18_10570 [Clavispora lusitaniae]|uniref:Uncharacterized protein n=1 Tax=Clavispora lusitaniae TaxID=36911 RepID=A0ACD0WD71_CLALS|nr:hypothetical protein EJF14_10570 [Clavispora lusitaniae]QFZ31223.1 hypothetical protein EJF16_10570 [Clavispora lusitaniae]QFZ36891.1 hypothetical protein EJF15_10570 [Clavispora lusitaniae]QFZ42575.1 hypothetical protein EJF18_10570 [Clavispora lusitaniae]QFZ48251.1 hypothetical protein EJF17_10570 [Clavispora lusitaniae]
MYRLSTILSGHESDVRGVAAQGDLLVSCSRDGTARAWNLATGTHETFFRSASFINSISSVPELGLVAVAGKDAVIYLCEPHESYAKVGDDTGRFQLVGHTNNVCSVRSGFGKLVSSSWDNTAKVWDLQSFAVEHDLVGHEAAVWDAIFVDSDTVLTCSADRTIRRWHRGTQVATYTGHTDVVRRLALLPGGRFVSASNDGSLKVWDMESGHVLHTLSGHASFVYDVAVTPHGLVSSGEDRTVCLWDASAWTVAQAISVPGISAWCVAVLPNGDVAVGTSDRHVYVFTESEERHAPLHVAEAYAQQVSAAAIPEQAVNLSRTDVPGIERLQQAGKCEGETVMVRSNTGIVEAHQWSGGSWVKIGDVVSAAGSGTKQQYNGKEYDYVFDVDVADGQPPLKLPFNATDNPYTAAEKFLADNDLPASYADEVVRFIAKNTEGVEIGQTGNPSTGTDPSAGSGVAASTSPAASAPEASTVLVTFPDFKPEQLVRGYSKLALPSDPSVPSALNDLVSRSALHLVDNVVPQILSLPGNQKLLGLDMLRICIPRITVADLIQSTDTAENILKMMLAALDEIAGEPTLVMMAARVSCNLTASVLFAQLFLTDEGSSTVFNSFFEDYAARFVKAVSSLEGTQSNKHFSSAAVAASAFLYNLSAYSIKNRMGSQSLSKIAELLDTVGELLVRADAEAAYRLCLTARNLRHGGVELRSWYSICKETYMSARFQEEYARIGV